MAMLGSAPPPGHPPQQGEVDNTRPLAASLGCRSPGSGQSPFQQILGGNIASGLQADSCHVCRRGTGVHQAKVRSKCDVMKHCHTFHVTHVATAGTPCTLGQLPDRRQPPACEHQRAALWMCQLRSLLLDRRLYPHPTRLLFRHTLQPCWRVVAWASAVVPPLPGPAWWNVVTLAPTWWFPVLRNSPRRMWRPRRLSMHRHRQCTHSHQRHRWPSLLTRSEQRHHSPRVGRL